MIERIGSDWGGFWIDTAIVPFRSTAICAGIGNDITFDMELISRFECRVVGIDPTVAAQRHIAAMLETKAITSENYEYIQRALWGSSGEYLECRSYRTVYGGGHEGGSKSVTLGDIFSVHHGVSIVKLDIEGSEFPVIKNLEYLPESVRQVACEFHHRLPEVPYQLEDAKTCSKILNGFGFKLGYMEKDYEETLYVRD